MLKLISKIVSSASKAWRSWRIRQVKKYFAWKFKNQAKAFDLFQKKWLTKQLVNLPNAISFSRAILAGPLAIAFALTSGWGCWAIGVIYALVALTDAWDGPIAMAFGCETDWGANLDPFADKCLVLPLLGILNSAGAIHPILLWSVIIADSGYMLIRIYKQLAGINGLKATDWGKIKFTLEAVVVGLLLLNWLAAVNILMAIALLMLFVNYIKVTQELIKWATTKGLPSVRELLLSAKALCLSAKQQLQQI